MSGARLAIIASAAKTGGGASWVGDLATSLPLVGPNNRYLFVVKSAMADRLDSSAGSRVVRVPRLLETAPLRVPWEQLFLPAKLVRLSIDAVLAPFNVLPLITPLPSSMQTGVVISNILPFCPEFWPDRSPYQLLRMRALRALTEASLRRADVVFLRSPEAERRLAKSLTKKRTIFLPNTPPPPSLLARAAAQEIPEGLRRRPFFLTVGDLLPHKGVEDAIAALGMLGNENHRPRLLIAGGPINRNYALRLQALADRVAAGSVVFLGPRDQAEVLALMKESVATLVCSRMENPNRIIAEAMSVASPIIAVDLQVSRDVCGKAALYYALNSPGELAARMADLLDHPEIAEELGELGHGLIQEVHWMDTSRRLLEALDFL